MQNPMATHGDRKVLKAAALALINDSIIQWLFAEYLKLIGEHPEAKA
jgi:hypothetical protein